MVESESPAVAQQRVWFGGFWGLNRSKVLWVLGNSAQTFTVHLGEKMKFGSLTILFVPHFCNSQFPRNLAYPQTSYPQTIFHCFAELLITSK